MTTRRKFGEVREDGYIFRGYQQNGRYEQWVSPETMARRKQSMREWAQARAAQIRKDPAALRKKRNNAAAYARSARRARPEVHMLVRARARAKEKGVEFRITADDFEIPKRCPVFGMPLCVADGTPDECSPELDRIDVRKGYVPGNVMVISSKANRMKRDATLADLRRFARFYLAFKPPKALPKRAP